MILKEFWCWESYYGAIKRLLGKDIELILEDGKIVTVQKISRSVIVLSDKSGSKQCNDDDLNIVKCVEKMIEQLPSPEKEVIFYHYIDHSFHRADDEDFAKRYSALGLSAIARKIGYNPASMRKLWIRAIGLATEQMKGIPECVNCIGKY